MGEWFGLIAVMNFVGEFGLDGAASYRPTGLVWENRLALQCCEWKHHKRIRSEYAFAISRHYASI